MESADLPRLMTVPAAARALGVGRDMLREAIARGDLSAVRLHPKGWPRIDVAELRRWVVERRGTLH